LAPEATKFGEIMQNNDHYVVQGHQFQYSEKPICDFLRVTNSNLPPVLQRFWDMADYGSIFFALSGVVTLFDALIEHESLH